MPRWLRKPSKQEIKGAWGKVWGSLKRIPLKGKYFDEYLKRQGVTEDRIKSADRIMGSPYSYKLNEVRAALRIYARLGQQPSDMPGVYTTEAQGILNSLEKYTGEKIKIALAILSWVRVYPNPKLVRKAQERIKSETFYPTDHGVRKAYGGIKKGLGIVKEKIKAADSRYRQEYLEKRRPADHEVKFALTIIDFPSNNTNKAVRNAIKILKLAHLQPSRHVISTALTTIESPTNYNPEQIKNSFSILTWANIRPKAKLVRNAQNWIQMGRYPARIKEVKEVLNILKKEWKFFIMIHKIAEQLNEFAEHHKKMKVEELLKSRKYLRELKWFESREQMWGSVSKLIGAIDDMLRLPLFDSNDRARIQEYVRDLRIDEAKVLYDTGVDLDREIAEKEPLLVDWRKVKQITQDILAWSVAFVAVDQQLRDLIEEKSKRR